jgi:hypothetical protein
MKKVEVVVYLFQGVIDGVEVYADDKNGKAPDKALAALREHFGQDFKTAEEFTAWMEAELEGDCDDEAHWHSTEIG